jgi:uncharacterized protein
MRLGLYAMVVIASGVLSSCAEPESVVISNTQQFTLVASDTKRQYRIFVDVPTEPPASSAGYPVVYFLDGNNTFLLAVGAWRLQATAENGFEPALVVAIGYEMDEQSRRKARYFDLTPRADSQQTLLGDNSLTEFGGADAYVQFLVRDLKPVLERRFKIDANRQTLFGHSLGGLFVLYTLFTHPDAFSTYVAGSPSIWWDNKSIFDDAERFSMTGINEGISKRLVIAVGANERRAMIDDAQRMAETLRTMDRLRVCFVRLFDENHVSTIPILVSRTVRFALSKRPSQCE